MENEDDQKEDFLMKVCIMKWIVMALSLSNCMSKLWILESIVLMFSVQCEPVLVPNTTAG